MVHYVGLDVSLKQTSICAVNQVGSVVREGVVDSEPEAIAAFVRSKAPGAVRVGLETGPTATWLWSELKQLGLPVICIDARHARAVLKMQINKSDRSDAAGIARIMQTGWFKEVRVKGLESHSVRALLASRALLVKIKRDLENQIRGLLKNVGLVIGRAEFNVFAVRAEELIEDRPQLIAIHRRPRARPKEKSWPHFRPSAVDFCGSRLAIGAATERARALAMPAGTRAQALQTRANSSGVVPASSQVAYRALLERALAAHRKKLAAFSALGGDCGSQRGPGSVIILRTISRSTLTSAIRRFVSSPLSACAGALSVGLEAGFFCFRRFMLFTIR